MQYSNKNESVLSNSKPIGNKTAQGGEFINTNIRLG